MENDPSPKQPPGFKGFVASAYENTGNWCRSKKSEVVRWLKGHHEVLRLKDLYIRESRQLGEEVGSKEVIANTGTAGETWIAFTARDRFGVALSGGGIRSATFNLGLLQALAQLGILKHVHYLSTVSGGGYVGGFWTAWLQRKGTRVGDARFPLGNDRRGGERAEVRHLREFSRFLLPRVRIFETEFWGIAMTVLGGLLPSLAAALAMLIIVWYLWLGLLALLTLPIGKSVIWLTPLLFGFLFASEVHWRRLGKSERNSKEILGYLFGCGLSGLLFWRLGGEWLPEATSDNWRAFQDASIVFAPAVLLGVCTLVLLFVRTVMARFVRESKDISILTGAERTMTRTLGLAAGLAAVAALWLVAGFIQEETGSWSKSVTAGGAVVSAGLFAWAKKWLMEPPRETHGERLLPSLISGLKRATPKVLALIVWLLLFLLVGASVHWWGLQRHGVTDIMLWAPAALAAGLLALTAWWFDPARVGMHEFYRSRISRCYLGASNAATDGAGSESERVAANRLVAERPGDDLTLGDLKSIQRPLHLVCVAANELSADPLGSLYRGARSAVLSANGISLGDETAGLDQLRFSAALTASAAAFNSQMGRVSMDLGPSVTFLMSALNLRLGLWVPHPTNPFRKNYLFPGRFFLAELLGLSRTDRKNLHLSDGSHFENFGLYELVRRHCRQIIVSDCGADPEVAFDDLANVLRRVREDFGVEIELDINPLYPAADRHTSQHAVVGTIHYNGITGMDKGTILFIKPGLTGDEPPDVLQYRTRNTAFPHEGTSDQFYDEAQWESYRRLGEHVGRSVLGFFEQPESKESDPVDRLFKDARARWHPAPPRQEEEFLSMTERCANLESDLLSNGPIQMRLEFFPEAAAMAIDPPKEQVPQSCSDPRVRALPQTEQELQILSYLMRLMQIMEDVWLAADLEHFWSHPLNEGWMNYFHRWASTPSFRRWWPVLGPIFSPGFREFAKERFDVGISDPVARAETERLIASAQLSLYIVSDRPRFEAGRLWGLFEQRKPSTILSGHVILGYELELLGYNGQLGGKKIPVGFVAVEETETAGEWTAAWRASEFFIPPALHGIGIVARMLDAVIHYYRPPEKKEVERRFSRIEVSYAPTDACPGNQMAPGPAKQNARPLGPAARYERVREIEFYKSRGFQYTRPENPQTGEITLALALGQATTQLARPDRDDLGSPPI